MTFYLYVLQNQWLAVALMVGVILVVLLCLTYQAMWRPRQEESERDRRIMITDLKSFYAWVIGFMPWVLIIIILGSIIYTITHVIAAAQNMLNW